VKRPAGSGLRAAARLAASAACLLGAACAASEARAQEAAAGGTLRLFAVPDLPAFTFLGASPGVIGRPGTARDLGVAITSAVDSAGKLRQGFGLEIAPWFLVPGLDIPLEDYRSRWWKFVVASTQLSLGTTRATGAPGSTEMALGLRLTLWDEGDPMRDRDYARRLGDLLRDAAPETPGGTMSDAAVAERLAPLQEAWHAAHWNARHLALAAAGGLLFEASEIDRGRGNGWSVWMVGGQPLGAWGQLLGQLQYLDRRRSTGDPDVTSFVYAARFLAGSGRFDTFLEVAGVAELDAGSRDEDGHGSWSGGLEFRVAPELWLSTGFGSTFQTTQQADRVLLLAGLRWGMTSQARWAHP
jgi:hypothetical protein